MKLITLLALLFAISCAPAIKVYGPVTDPCSVPVEQPRNKIASLGGEIR